MNEYSHPGMLTTLPTWHIVRRLRKHVFVIGPYVIRRILYYDSLNYDHIYDYFAIPHKYLLGNKEMRLNNLS